MTESGPLPAEDTPASAPEDTVGGAQEGDHADLRVRLLEVMGNPQNERGRSVPLGHCCRGAAGTDLPSAVDPARRLRHPDRPSRSFLVRATVLALVAVVAFSGCRRAQRTSSRPRPAPGDQAETASGSKIVITIVYDNNPGRADLKAAWGFGCVVQGLEKTILFDTGGDGRVLLANMRSLGIEADQIDAVVISHIHGDHTGGLESFLSLRPGVSVFIPAGFPESFKEQIRSRGGDPVEGKGTVEVCPGAKTTGTLGPGAIEEHGLCVKTPSGWVLITGCAHPGVGNMAARAKEITDGPIELVVGGFHMGSYSKAQIEAVIDRFGELGVKHVAPCHCSGEQARKLFKQRYGERCALAGVGSVFRLASGR